MSTALSIGSAVAAFYLGLAAGLNRARRSWDRGRDEGIVLGYRRGSRDAERLAKRALHQLNDLHCRQMAELVHRFTGHYVPESDEVAAEKERRS